jgi:meprin B
MEHNFNKYKRDAIDVLDTNYDYNSIMHYGKYAFSKNGNPTLLAIQNPDRNLGQRDGFSEIDIVKVNALYDCKSNYIRYYFFYVIRDGLCREH